MRCRPSRQNNDGPLIYVSFGSLGAGDIDLLKRIIALFGKTALPRAGQCRRLQGPVHRRAGQCASSTSWFPQPSVIPQVDRRHPPRRQQLASPSASISASRRSSCPMSGTATTTPRASRRPATASSCRATTGPTQEFVATHRGLPHRSGDEGEARRDFGAHAGGTSGPAKAARIDSIAAGGATRREARHPPRRISRTRRPATISSTGAPQPDALEGSVAFHRPACSTRGRTTSREIGHLGLHAGPLAARHPARRVLPFRRRPRHLHSDDGEAIEVAPGTVVHVPAGWTGRMHRP